MNVSATKSSRIEDRVIAPPSKNMSTEQGLLLPDPGTIATGDQAYVQSLEALLALIQEAQGKYAGSKTTEATAAQKEREQKLSEALNKIDEEAKARNSPGFFKAVFRVIKDLASDLFTDPGKTFSDLGKNLKEMVNSPNFWADVKNGCMAAIKVIALVAAVAASVVTCGAASPILAGAVILLSVASAVDSQFHVLQKMGVDPKIAAIIDVAMGLAATILSLGASSAGTVSELARAAKQVRDAAGALQAGTAIVGGAATMVDSGFEKGRLDRSADQKQIANAMQQLEDEIKELLEEIRAQKENGSAENDAIMSVADTQPKVTQILTSLRA